MDRKDFLRSSLAAAAAAVLPAGRVNAQPAMRYDEYVRHDAVGLAALVKKREVTPSELLATAIARIADVNPKVNAVVGTFEDVASGDIARGLPDGPLTGVPFLVKDLRIAVCGMRTTAGSRVLADAPVATADSPLAAAYRATGAVMFGKTNCPEFGINPVTEPALFGITRNPWNLERTAGGSSGGAAAAVAAGMVPAAHGNDGGGSLRIPAAACGVLALKLTRGRISMAPDGEGWGGMSTQNVVTRSVRDSAVLLDASCGPVAGDPYWRDPPEQPYAAQIARPPTKLRMAFTTAAFLSDGLDLECAEAVRDAARLCASLGHNVTEATPNMPFADMRLRSSAVVAANVAAALDAAGEARGRDVREREVEPGTWVLAEIGRRMKASDYARAIQYLHRFARNFVGFFNDYDVLITATTGSPAIPHGMLSGNDGAEIVRRTFAWMPNTNVFNVSGQPAMTVPLGQSKSGLPIGIQFAARAGEEGTLLRLAAQLESARPWFSHLPQL
jgi:amidase